MVFICQYCDRLLIENPDEYENYLTTSHKKNDKNFYIQYTINNISFVELDKILENYISTHNKNMFFIQSVVTL